MNNFKKTLFAIFLCATHAAFAHTYNEEANQEALNAIHTYQQTNSRNTPHPETEDILTRSPYWDDPQGPWKDTLNTMISRVRIAVLNGANSNLIIYDQTTLFLFMISSCDKPLLDILIQAGADINAKNDFGWTALMSISSSKGARSIELAKTLINSPGIDINIQDKDGKTALMHACFWGNHELVKILLEAGADKDKVDRYGNTAQVIAANECYDK
jgi:hypothetical protein